MKRLAFLALVAAAAVTVAGQARSAGAPRIAITEAGGTTFPVRSYILTLPASASLTPAQVHVTENGRPATGVQLVPANASGPAHFGVVLVIDSSDSMAGKPIAGAMAAARAFAARRAPAQELAFVAFNSKTQVVLPFTRSNTTIATALDKPPRLAYGTHIYDALGTAVQLLRAAHVDSGSVVLLSDGADLGSRASLASAVRSARASDVRVFTVGLRSRFFNRSSLQGLAEGTGGSYAEESSPSQLTGLYNRLGLQLASEYLLRYRSLAGPQEAVNVAVRVAGVSGTARTRYQTPALAEIPPTPPYHRSLINRVSMSPITAGVVVLLCALLVGFAIASVIRPRRSQVQRRMSEFVTLASAQDLSGNADSGRRAILLEGAEHSLQSRPWWTRFNDELEIAQITMPAIQIVGATVAATLFAFALLTVVTGSLLFGIPALVLPFAVRAYLKRKLEARRRQFGQQLPDSLQIIASALRAGHGLAASLSVVVENASDPMKSELQRVIAAEQLGAPLDDALAVVVERMDNRDLEQLAFVARLQRETGVSAAEVIDHVTDNVRERFELRRLVKTLTAQGRLSRWIVTALPVGLIGAIVLLDPHYLHPLFSHPLGRVLLVGAGLLVIGGSVAIGRIVDIEV